MSKGEIIGHIAEGKYRVRQKLAVGRIDQEIAKLSDQIAELAVSLPTAKVALIQAKDAVDSKARDIDLAIPDLQAGAEGARKKITKLQSELVRLGADLRLAEIKVADLIAENLSALKRRGQLEAIPEGREIDAWCADYTRDLAGEVGLVDIDDEGGQGSVIQPGYDGGAVYSKSRDGALFPNIAQSSPQIFFNAAILPGVQKWMPRYRVGEITNLSVDVCTVALDQAASSAQQLPINETDTLADVPIMYMDCNGSAFEEGDRVLVRFTANGPLVVGFEKEPVDCLAVGFIFAPAMAYYYNNQTTWGAPFEDSGVPVNPPLGTEGSTEPAWTGSKSAGQYSFVKGYDYTYGMRNWIGPDGLALSWHGPSSRVTNIASDRPGGSSLPRSGTKVFKSNNILVDMAAYGLPYDNVQGAAFSQGDPGKLTVVVSDTLSSGVVVAAYKFTMVEGAPSGIPIFIDSLTIPDAHMEIASGVYFNRSGSAAVMTLHAGGDRATVQFDGSSFVYELELFDNPGTYTRDYGDSFSYSCDAGSDGGNLGQWASGSSYNYEEYYYPEVRQLIYVDYIGDNQVRVELLYPEFRKTQSKSASTSCGLYFADGTTKVRPTGSSEVVEKSSSMAPMKIQVNGADIFTFDKGVDNVDKVTYVHGGSTDSAGRGTYSVTDTVNESRSYLDNGTLFIDARTGALFFTVNSTSRIASGSISGDNARPFGFANDTSYFFTQTYFEDWYIEATAAYSASTTKDITKETITHANAPNKGINRALQIIDFRRSESGVWPLSWSEMIGHPYDDMKFVAITQNGNFASGAFRTLWQASSAGTSRSAVTSFVYYNRKTEQTITINHFDNVTNPVGTIMDRSGGDYFFLNVSVA